MRRHARNARSSWSTSFAAWILAGAGAAVPQDGPHQERILVDEEGPAFLERVGGVRVLHVSGTLEERLSQFGVLMRDELQHMVDAGERRRRSPSGSPDRAEGADRVARVDALLAILSRASRIPRSHLEGLVAARARDGATAFPELRVVAHEGERVLAVDGFVPGEELPELFLVAGDAARELSSADPLRVPLPRGHLATDNGASGVERVRSVATQRIVRPAPERRPARHADEARWLALYPRDDEPFDVRVEHLVEDAEGTIANVRLASAIDTGSRLNDVVFARLYRAPAVQGLRPAVILLHHLENRFWLEESVAADLRRRGIDVALLHLPWYGRRRPRQFDDRRFLLAGAEALQRFAVQAHADVQRLRRFLAEQEGVRTVGLLGISLGGIVGAVIGGVEGTFDDLIPVLAGGPPELVLRDGEREAAMLRRAFERAGIDVERDHDALRPLDPTVFAGRVEARRVLLVNATDDTVIPRSATLRLWEAFQQPELAWFPGTHITVAFQMSKVLDAVERHLERER